MASDAQKEVVQTMAKRDAPEILLFLGYPPVIRVHPPFSRRERSIRLSREPSEPCGEAGLGLHLVVLVEARAGLMNFTAPFIAGFQLRVSEEQGGED